MNNVYTFLISSTPTSFLLFYFAFIYAVYINYIPYLNDVYSVITDNNSIASSSIITSSSSALIYNIYFNSSLL